MTYVLFVIFKCEKILKWLNTGISVYHSANARLLNILCIFAMSLGYVGKV